MRFAHQSIVCGGLRTLRRIYTNRLTCTHSASRFSSPRTVHFRIGPQFQWENRRDTCMIGAEGLTGAGRRASHPMIQTTNTPSVKHFVTSGQKDWVHEFCETKGLKTRRSIRAVSAKLTVTNTSLSVFIWNSPRTVPFASSPHSSSIAWRFEAKTGISV